MENENKILIVGAGPTGLVAAIELARRNIPLRIIDKDIKPVPTSNALAMQTRTLEIMNNIGLLDELLAVGYPLKVFNIRSEKEKMASINLRTIKSRFPFILGIAQNKTETVLLAALKNLGVNVDMETKLSSITEHPDYLEVTLNDKQGNESKEKYSWVLACDGGKSIIREKLDIDFSGHDLPQHFVMLDARVSSNFPEHEVNAFQTSQGAMVFIPYSKDYSRMIAEVTNDPILKKSTSPTSSDFERLIKERCNESISFSDVQWASGFWIRERLAKQYRHHRVFFLGDAAHLHSPMGGQGMNTGIQDAHNLIWKLALVWKNQAPEKLLDSYEMERQPIAKRVLKASTFMTYVVTLKNSFLVHFRNFIMRKLLSSKKILSKITAQLTETDINYEKSALTHDNMKNSQSIKAGTFMVDVPLGHHYLSETLGNKKHMVMILVPDHIETQPLVELKNFITKNDELFDIVLVHHQALPENFSWQFKTIKDSNKNIIHAYRADKPMLYLFRPDRYIGYRGELNIDALKQHFHTLGINV